MENLFYGRKMAQVGSPQVGLILQRRVGLILKVFLQVFDLKGSLRNRNVKTESGKESCEVVLLDENLLKLIHDNPLYIRSHCKTILRAAIHSDASFLSSHLIIDYSLLVGRDDATDQLVVGIIGEDVGGRGRGRSVSIRTILMVLRLLLPTDYIRTFTWDKKLEMVVKSTGILGGQGDRRIWSQYLD